MIVRTVHRILSHPWGFRLVCLAVFVPAMVGVKLATKSYLAAYGDEGAYLGMVALVAFIAAQPDPRPSRPEAIRALLKDGLTGLGYLPAREDPEGAN